MIERTCGRSRRENAGISSESMVRIHAIESLRFPGEGSSAQGKFLGKVRPPRVSRDLRRGRKEYLMDSR